MRAFTEAAERANRRQLADLLTVTRAAEYEEGDFKKVLGKLSDGSV